MRRFAAAAPPRSVNPPQTDGQARGGVKSLIWIGHAAMASATAPASVSGARQAKRSQM